MSRFLFVVPPLSGHVLPAVAVGRALAERGHEVAWAGSEAYLRPRVGPDALVFPTGLRPYRGQRDRGMRAVKSLWDGFLVPFARATLPAVDRAVLDYRPDALAVDQHALAGSLVAQRHGLPWATLAPTLMEIARPFAALSTVEQWMRDRLAALWREAGMPGQPVADLRFSPHLVIAFTIAELMPMRDLPPHYAFVGAALTDRAAPTDFPWSLLDSTRRLVLVTTGTLAADLARDFYPRIAEAVRPLAGRVQAVLHTDDDGLPDHVIAAAEVPVLQLMPKLSGVVCHGGLGTTSETLAHGVPLVIAPIRYDQPMLARQVAAAGAGVRVRFGRATAEQLRSAIVSILDNSRYGVGAARLRDAFAVAGGADEAARRLAALA